MTADLKNLLLMEIGKTADPTYKAALDTLWDAYAVAADAFPMSQYLYTKRHALAVVLGSYYNLYDTEEKDVVEKESQKFKQLLELYDRTSGFIDSNEAIYSFNTSPLVGLISRATPLEYKDRLWWQDPSSILLSGSPVVTEPYSLPVE